ncbi:MAG TPA: peptidoglycan editing factor PgeF [Terriglobales bacterium]|nr:peptidoglycan editing factor PgeF [Terriglobales bacterium]
MPTRKKASTPRLLQAPPLARLPWLVHAFSTREDGNLGFPEESTPAAVRRNRAKFLQGLLGGKRKAPQLVTLKQIHSDLIHRLDAPPKAGLKGDGLITNVPGLLLSIQTADCLPILLVDSKLRAIGAFHAGWRGTLERIAEKGVGLMQRHFGSRARDLVAAIGPGIQVCCYQVGREVRERFESQFAYAGELFREFEESDPVREKYPLLFLTARAPGHSELAPRIFLDLVKANLRQLKDAGVRAANIHASPLCTACHTELLFSHRAEKGKTGRMLAVIGLKN